MKLKSLQLRNFQSLQELTLQDIPENVKLVLMVGSQGTERNSVFAAFKFLAGQGGKKQEPVPGTPVEIDLQTHLSFTERSYSSLHRNSHDSGAIHFVSKDQENDVSTVIQSLCQQHDLQTGMRELKQKVLMPVNKALERIFGHDAGKLQVINIIPTSADGPPADIHFKKGDAVLHYDQICSGEKEVFNILLSFALQGEYGPDTLFFYDETELHLNSRIQYNFIKELVQNWIPDSCQLWTASYSQGFIRYARESDHAVIFDFDDRDFQHLHALRADAKDDHEIYEITVGRELLHDIFRDHEIVFIEQENRKYLAYLVMDQKIFVPEKNRDAVLHKVKSGEYGGLVNRFFLTDDEIQIIRRYFPRLGVLGFYSMENYLFHPENLEEYYAGIQKPFNKPAYIKKILEEKEHVINDLSGRIVPARQEYAFFRESGMEKSLLQKRFTTDRENTVQSKIVLKYLSDDDPDIFLKAFSLKDYGRSFPELQHISTFKLSKTNWFIQQIASILNQQA